MQTVAPPDKRELPGHSSLQMAGLVSARFRAGMRPLAIGTALCVALSAPLADLLLERHDLLHRAEAYASDVAALVAAQGSDPAGGRAALSGGDAAAVRALVEARLQRGAEDVARVDVLDGAGRELARAEQPLFRDTWPIIWGEVPVARAGKRSGTVRVAFGEPEWIQRDLLLLSAFGALGLLLGLLLFYFPLRLFREEDLVLLFARRSLRAAEEERLRLSRELHDGLGQTLGTAAVALARLGARLGTTQEAAEASRLIDAALDELRHVALGLRPPSLDDLGLGAAVSALAGEAEGTGLSATVAIAALPRLDAELELACFRLAQEAVGNVIRHARARTLRLALFIGKADAGADALVLEVEDDGCGFSSASGLGLGLVGARERAARLSGRFDIESAVGRGTRFRAILPLRLA